MRWKTILCGLLCGTLLCGCTPAAQTAVTKSSKKTGIGHYPFLLL